MQWKPLIASVGVLAGTVVALSGATAHGATSPTALPLTAGASSTTGPNGTTAASGTAALTAGALYVAPGGSAGAAGTESAPTTLAAAISRVTSGGTIYLRGGTYASAQTITIPQGADGTASALTTLAAYPGESPVLNFSAQAEATTNRGLALNASYWHVNGITVEHAGDNGIFVGGSHNVIEHTVTRFNRDSGLQLSRIASDTPEDEWPSDNLILSAESHDNADSDGEDADGFAAKLTVGPGNVFRYDVSHHNIDDGWDLYTKTDTGPIGPVTIEDSLSYGNGTLSDGTVNSNGDRNGYKLGGDDIPVDHVVRRSIAYGNGHHGFTYNRNLGEIALSDDVSIDNAERNFSFDGGTSVFRGNTSCRSGDGSNDKTVGDADGSNQFWSGTNGSRCSAYSGALGWSFASDGSLVVTFGGNRVTP
ncbi:right-handed parallel beta-helix repeat-containing protein [Streptomyces sp. NBC_00247]|uniref:right-handed parallel beta-helix repeat-containing protein n=1 Tax=Streptomyces sp. NBC_00247 TaxID=2975689 RepID=UPI002E2CFF7F|nr:right-handed parallel beta-helix repeat-containing protein [Streptomyces sp. NBC_00247]